ncbi:uncharacterized protein CTRU02_210088 [Colletotrichum truncatum]|uniref:Uncharacterized protein n=1 Tax=Colletotrichum truncatum TaxID=5467 RepID=A0ACC3YUG1_COLTU|nr:uncharacterized protein CTRU02_02664 [Colletotrichum truncatum]KAF6798690.1 hypothetical protein CTRU02_02664 [Colletotrichum truncatum]
MPLTPRMNPYTRILARLYEAIISLWILRRVNGPHLVTYLNDNYLQGVRRRFLKNLCFFCDYKKGGESTTALGLEEQEGSCVFWISSNEGVGDHVVLFLNNVLAMLKRVDESKKNRASAVADLMAYYAKFAAPRMKKETRILHNAIKRCLEVSEASSPAEGTCEFSPVTSLLLHLQDSAFDNVVMCKKAYQVSHDHQLQLLKRLGQEPDDSIGQGPAAQAFRDAKHMIGRLAAHAHAVHELFDDSERLQKLLESYRVDKVDTPLPASVPPGDSHTTLAGVLKRLLPARDDRYESYLCYLKRMDSQLGIENTLCTKLKPGALKPCVHAEIQMLHHFHDTNRQYFANDRFVACSKFACILCESFFRNHPARVILLDSHQKTYPNWGAIQLPRGASDPGWQNWRKIMNDVIHDIKAIVVDQISQQLVSSMNHPDSISQFTASVDEAHDSTGSETDYFEYLSSESDDCKCPISMVVFLVVNQRITTAHSSTSTELAVQLAHTSVEDQQFSDDDDGEHGAPLNQFCPNV